jgi:hypothetical protein
MKVNRRSFDGVTGESRISRSNMVNSSFRSISCSLDRRGKLRATKNGLARSESGKQAARGSVPHRGLQTTFSTPKLTALRGTSPHFQQLELRIRFFWIAVLWISHTIHFRLKLIFKICFWKKQNHIQVYRVLYKRIKFNVYIATDDPIIVYTDSYFDRILDNLKGTEVSDPGFHVCGLLIFQISP